VEIMTENIHLDISRGRGLREPIRTTSGGTIKNPEAYNRGNGWFAGPFDELMGGRTKAEGRKIIKRERRV
jgi:hypothetical protein